MASSPSRTGPVAPSSARRSGRGLGHAIGVCPGGGRRHGRAHGFLWFLRGVFGFYRRRLLFVFSETQERVLTRFLASERLDARAGSSGRAVLRLCALCCRANAVNERPSAGFGYKNFAVTPRVVFCSATARTLSLWYAETAPRVSQYYTAAYTKILAAPCLLLW